MPDALNASLKEMLKDGVCIALSGGVDSSLLLALLSEYNQENKLHAVTFASILHPLCDTSSAKELAKKYDVSHTVLNDDVLSNKNIRMNPPDRCYHCKKMLFSTLCDFAKSKNLKWVIDGTNKDDLSQYRPGLKALKELSIRSPLAEFGCTKADTRKMASAINLSVAQKPSSPCLATRLPYNTEITEEILKRVEYSEAFIRTLGVDTVRVRTYNDMARIEVSKEDFNILISKKDEIIPKFKEFGFNNITLDLEGFRSGSMDVKIMAPPL